MVEPIVRPPDLLGGVFERDGSPVWLEEELQVAAFVHHGVPDQIQKLSEPAAEKRIRPDPVELCVRLQEMYGRVLVLETELVGIVGNRPVRATPVKRLPLPREELKISSVARVVRMLLDPVECPDGHLQHTGIFRLAVQGCQAVQRKGVSVRPLLITPSLAFRHPATPAACLIESAILGIPHHVAEELVTVLRDRKIQAWLAGKFRHLRCRPDMPRLGNDHLLLRRREGPITRHIREVSAAFTIDDEGIPPAEYPVKESRIQLIEYLSGHRVCSFFACLCGMCGAAALRRHLRILPKFRAR